MDRKCVAKVKLTKKATERLNLEGNPEKKKDTKKKKTLELTIIGY